MFVTIDAADDLRTMDELDEKFRVLRLTSPIIANLLELCNTPFEMSKAVVAWQRFGWRYTPQQDDEFGFQVEIGDDVHLTVAPNGEDINCMVLPFCWWPNYDEEFATSRLLHGIEKRRFGAAFTKAADLTRKTIAPPFYTGRDADEDRHQYAVWAGNHAWLILQQAAFDVQFGIEINFWLEPIKGERFTPITPLIDWLTSRHSGQ